MRPKRMIVSIPQILATILCLMVVPALTLPFLASPALAGSPVSKGTEIFTGAISYSSAGQTYYENEAGNRTKEWVLTPGGGIFFKDGFAVQLVLEGRWFSQGDIQDDYFGWGPKLEYYLDTTSGEEAAGHFLPHVGLAYLWGKTTLKTSNSSLKYNSGLTSFSAGVAYMLSEQIAMDLVINYRTGNFKEKEPVDGLDYKADRWTVLVGVKAFVR